MDNSSPPRPRDRESRLRSQLEKRLRSPGKWELLFDENDRLIEGTAERLRGTPEFRSPTLTIRDKPKSAFVRYEAAVPAVHDWDVFEVFREEDCLDLYPRFFLAGERERYRLNPAEVRVGILIAGGPAAGLNMVVDSIVKRHFSLATQLAGRKRKHRVKVLAFIGGYAGLARGDTVSLAPSASALQGQVKSLRDETVWLTDEWATDAGVRIKALREKPIADTSGRQQHAEKQARQIVRHKLDILYVIGGNGTLDWASDLSQAVRQRTDRQIVVVGGPKTMDNDVNFTDVTFGFRTAVDNATEFIRTVHASAQSMNRVGVIELFGAASGFVALHAGYVSGVADYVMIPELEPNEDDVVDYLDRRRKKNAHAVVVVAEGALSEFRHGTPEVREEAFNNFVKKLRKRFGSVVDVRARYLMRDTPPNSFDLDLCKYSGKLMVDTALAGFTDCSVNLWQGDYVLVPFSTATAKLKQVSPWSYYLQTLLDRERLVMLER